MHLAGLVIELATAERAANHLRIYRRRSLRHQVERELEPCQKFSPITTRKKLQQIAILDRDASKARVAAQRTLDQELQRRLIERLQSKDSCARQQWRDYFERWILRRCADQRNPAFLDCRQQSILLCFVEAMD